MATRRLHCTCFCVAAGQLLGGRDLQQAGCCCRGTTNAARCPDCPWYGSVLMLEAVGWLVENWGGEGFHSGRMASAANPGGTQSDYA